MLGNCTLGKLSEESSVIHIPKQKWGANEPRIEFSNQMIAMESDHSDRPMIYKWALFGSYFSLLEGDQFNFDCIKATMSSQYKHK